MKHYSASLEFDAQVDQGNLTITADDALIITDINNLSDTEVATLGNAEGLFIIGGTIDTATTTVGTAGDATDAPGNKYYLSGKGQEKQLKAIQSGFVSQAPGQDPDNSNFIDLVGAQTIYLSYSEGVTAADLISGTAGTSGATNNVATFFGSGQGFQLALPEGVSDTNVKQGIVDNTAGAEVLDFYLTTGHSEGDAGEHFSVGMSDFFPDTNNTIPIYTTGSGSQLVDSVITQDTSGHVTIGATGAGNTRNLTVTGDLTVNGTTTTVNSTTVNIDDKYLAINNAAGGGSTTADGGLLVTLATAVQQPSETSGTTGTHAGIRYDESTQRWQTTIGTTVNGGADGDWEDIGAGAVNVYAADITFANNATSVTVAAGTHGLPGTDLTISLYEYVDSSGDRVDDGTSSVVGKSSIIPENILIHTTTTPGNIVISMPAETGSQVYRLVVKG